MLIEGIGIAGYRSFGSEVQRIGPFSKVNLFIGQNNSGKSNILRFLNQHYPEVVKSIRGNKGTFAFTSLDKPLGDRSGMIRVEIGRRLDDFFLPAVFDRFMSQMSNQTSKFLEIVLRSPSIAHNTELAWFPYESSWSDSAPKFILSKTLFKDLASNEWRDRDWHELCYRLANQRGGSLEEHWVPRTVQQLAPIAIQDLGTNTAIVSALRRISDSDESAGNSNEFTGAGVIRQLQRLQNPDHDQQELKEDFKAINEFLRFVTGNKSATLEIPHNRERILVHMDGKTLPLMNLGTGIHEVVILAAAATVVSDSIFCIEEPELHVHPILQRKLVKYLQDNTDNQYFIATHSAHILDTPGAAIFHVRSQDGFTTVDPVYTASERSLVCSDLGYKASDLLQANCIIWVEGPSDRIYLQHWIQSLDDSLIEGLHYSIMFYGGRLLSHLTANDPEVNEFISLRRLNRYISIIMDSDRPKKYVKMGNYETKKRISDEFNEGPGFAWITAGREIENYIPTTLLKEAVKTVHPSAERLSETGRYARSLHFFKKNGDLKTQVDKVKVARAVTQHPVQLEVLDLRQQLSRLLSFIREANGIPEPDTQGG